MKYICLLGLSKLISLSLKYQQFVTKLLKLKGKNNCSIFLRCLQTKGYVLLQTTYSSINSFQKFATYTCFDIMVFKLCATCNIWPLIVAHTLSDRCSALKQVKVYPSNVGFMWIVFLRNFVCQENSKMTPTEFVYLLMLIISLGLGHLVKVSRLPAQKQLICTGSGVLMVLILCGQQSVHSFFTTAITATIIKLFGPR